jgi:hypothetical protein
MEAFTNGTSTPPTRTAVRGLLIVARDQMALYEALQYAYSDSEKLAVLLDRRRTDRRQAVQTVSGERRRRDRRSPLSISDDLRFQQYVLVRPHPRRPHD